MESILEQLNQLEELNLEPEKEPEKKYGCVVLIPSHIDTSDQHTYTNQLLKQYCDEVDPYVVMLLDEVLNEFKEDEDLYEDIHEFCLKNYGGYVDKDNVVSTINYNSIMSSYKIIRIYNAKEMDEILLPLEINIVINKNKELHNQISGDLFKDNLDCNVAYVEYNC